MNDEYEKAYSFADATLANTADRLLCELSAKLNEKDIGTLRDRIADAYLFGLRQREANVAGETRRGQSLEQKDGR